MLPIVWRGPVWVPVNVLIVRTPLNLHPFYGDDFKVEYPTGLVALMLDVFERVEAKAVLESERSSLTDRLLKEQVGGRQRD
jgi:hypothetical protein